MSRRSSEEVLFAKAQGAKLRERRTGAGLSRRQFAAMVGVHRNTLERWERGTSEPSLFQVRRLREIFNSLRKPEPQKECAA